MLRTNAPHMEHRTHLPSNSAHWLFAALLSLAWAHVQAQEQWPLVITNNGDQVQVFAPQPESFDGTRFNARAAVALKRGTDKDPVFGALWGEGVLAVDRVSRMGDLVAFTVTDLRIPGVEGAELTAFKDMLSAEIPQRTAPIAIDWIISALETEQRHDDAYVNEPPVILYRETPSVLIFIDGEPVYEEVKDVAAAQGDDRRAKGGSNTVQRVVNTPFLLVRLSDGDHYLYGSGLWYRAREVQGTWKNTTSVPEVLQDLARKVDDTAALTATASSTPPTVVVSTVPAELLDLDGSPKFEPLPKTGLLYATNTEDDLFLDINSQDYYLLASGRWFATRDPKNGPWRYVLADQLPTAFAQIPEGSNKDGVLAHVAGTAAATEAVRDAQIPQTASVDRRTASVDVTYDGDPRFDRVPGTNVEQAVNASTVVLRIDGRYHVCDNAVWFNGNTPHGPWTVSTEVPVEVNDIPPSSPLYNIRYVYVYDHTPDQVFVGYTPGYLGSFVQNGTVIYGTGHYYPFAPGFWHPRPFTWGFGMWYDPWVGWGQGMGWGMNWYYPAWGYYGQPPYGFGWWGPFGYQPPHCHHSDRGCYYGHRDAGGGGSRGNDDQRPPRTAAVNLYAERTATGVRPTIVERSGRTISATEKPASGTAAPNTKPAKQRIPRDHFTDAAGNVYRQDGNRTEQYKGGQWNKVPAVRQQQPPTPARSTQPAVKQPTAPTTRPPASTTRPPASTTRPPAPATRPTAPAARPTPPARPPQQIQQDRQRGQQRVMDMNYGRQQRANPPAARPAPQQRSAPAQPRPAPAPKGSGGGKR